MEAASVDTLPTGGDWQYEPKWDGFRCLAFQDGDTIRIQSKAGKPLGRYFPDIIELLAGLEAHGTRFLRWRPEKAPRQCRMSQLQ